MKDKMTIIFFSGTMDKAIAMLILATTAASMGMDVKVYCTFWGLSFIKKNKSFDKKNLLQKMLECLMPSNMNKLPLSSMNMAGMGPVMMKKLMQAKKTPSIDELFKMANEFKVKFIACSTSCGIMGVEPENLLDGVEIAGATTFLGEAQNAKINLFI